MGSLETLLRLIELVGAAILLLALVGATIRGSRRFPLLLAAAAVFGLVFLNPLGVAAKPTRGDPRPVRPVGTADTGVHWVKVLGVPVAWFVPYSKKYLFFGENSPTAALKLRYGLSFLPTTGAKTVLSQCSNSISDPCWRDDYPLVQHDSRGRTLLVPLTEAPFGNVYGQVSYIHVPHFYAVRLGLGSVEGLAYWILLLGAAGLLFRARRVGWRAVVAAAGALVAGGIGLNLLLAAAATPTRSASSREPELVPKAPPVPHSSGKLVARPISDLKYGDDCVQQDGRTTTILCRGADQVTAVQAGGRILAVWTAQPKTDFRTQLRVRRLSPSGRPLGPSRLLLRPWSRRTRSDPAHGNCHIPADVQAAAIVRGRVLVVWSDSCGLFGTGHVSNLVAIVLDRGGRLVRKPFVVAHVAQAYGSSGLGVPFWLSSTTSGRPLLVWSGRSRESLYRTGLFTAFLDGRGRTRRVNEIVVGSGWIGNLVVGCSSRCVVARAAAPLELDFLSPTGAVASRQSADLGSPNVLSRPVATAAGGRFYVGILATQRGGAATAFVVTIRKKEAPSVARVWANVPAGGSSGPGIPDALGMFGAATGVPTLAWQASTTEGSKRELTLYLSDGRRRSSKSLAALREPTFVGGGGTLVALGATGPFFPEPVSVRVPRP